MGVVLATLGCMRFVPALAAAALLFAGCSPATTEPAPAPSPSASVDDYEGEVIEVPTELVTPSTADGTGTFSTSSVLPDPRIMATMSCEVPAPATLDRIRRRWGDEPLEAVQVEVGEGLTPGEIWWLVAYRTEKDGDRWSGNQWLTNAPGLAEGADATWINSGGVYIAKNNASFGGNLHWDEEGTARAQSALAKSLDCLEQSS